MKQRFGGPLAFIATLGICLTIIIPSISSLVTSAQVRVAQLNTDNTIRISEAITTPINQIRTVAAYIEGNKGDLSNFDELAAIIVDSPYVRNLIIAPNGVVTKVYPATEDNNNVLGLDYFTNDSQGNREAVIAAQSKQLLLAGPFTTVVGDQAISGRLPVYLTNDQGQEYFWGLISITLFYPQVLEGSHIDTLLDQGITYELWHNNVDSGEPQVIFSNGDISPTRGYVDKPVELLNAQWYLRVSPVPRWYEFSETWGYLAVALFVSFIVSRMVMQNHHLTHAKEKLEGLVHYDPLTGILNRQGMFAKVEKLVAGGKMFQVNYLDLDQFKLINDRYGHATGDQVLVGFAHRINKFIDSNYVFARISGDEFILLHVANDFDTIETRNFWNIIAKEFTQPIANAKNTDIYLSFSRGSAVYPTDGSTLDSVIFLADEQMYREKSSKTSTNQ